MNIGNNTSVPGAKTADTRVVPAFEALFLFLMLASLWPAAINLVGARQEHVL